MIDMPPKKKKKTEKTSTKNSPGHSKGQITKKSMQGKGSTSKSKSQSSSSTRKR